MRNERGTLKHDRQEGKVFFQTYGEVFSRKDTENNVVIRFDKGH